VSGREVREHALAMPGAWPDQPWDAYAVAKVGPVGRGKIFAFFGDGTLGVKAAPTREEADEWLARYPDDARPMPHLGHVGWNELRVDRAIPVQELLEAVEDSYDLVVEKMPRKDRPGG
jgi:predicted DNA-binding protein (MmcQ/YjbR family)